MKKVDYIIVGSGLAGISFCETLKQHKKSFVVVDDGSQQTSAIAGGLYNPIILKRFTKTWKAEEQLEIALPLYAKLEKELEVILDYKTPVYRLFASVEEQNNWFEASDKPALSKYLSTELLKNISPYIKNDFGFGKVLNTGRIDTGLLVSKYKKHLKKEEMLLKETFDFKALQIKNSSIIYNDYEAKQIVFAEGFGLKHNPFFNYLPLDGTKGELITIHAPNLKIDYVLKSSVFLIPLGDDLYRLGATYDWKDKTTETTLSGKQELLNKLKRFLKCDFTIVNHIAGIRPTVNDRRPLIGKHPKYNNIYVLNGLGTRGVMIGPYVSRELYNHIELQKPLEKEIDINRYSKLY
ncbi:FAD-dependent oxidoreductase [Flavobacteriaceae bacterium AU392]|nr:FAD-binding oxidoreductase [Flavobacteriaceae bacterium]RKM81665.1 FAD-dependent oxidoreductase [Flavobacteriaceae bacterium AU392]